MCCSGVFGDVLSETRPTLDGRVILTKRLGPQVVVNQRLIKQCDKMATNGIVHKIDKLLPEALNRYVTRHLRHNGRLSWHMHFGGDNFGRRLEDIVQNMLEGMFGVRRSRMRQGEGAVSRSDAANPQDDGTEGSSTRNAYRDWPDAPRRRQMARQPERMWDNWRQSGTRGKMGRGSKSEDDGLGAGEQQQWSSDDPNAGAAGLASSSYHGHHGHRWPYGRGHYWPYPRRDYWPDSSRDYWPPYIRDYWHDWHD